MIKYLTLVLITLFTFGCSTQPKTAKSPIDNSAKQVEIKEAFLKEAAPTKTIKEIGPQTKLKYIQASLRNIIEAYVFEANDNLTWISVKNTISTFLTEQWKDSVITGASPKEAFTVEVGLGSTRTAQDIINGIMNVRVQVAVEKSGEFTTLTFQQQLQI